MATAKHTGDRPMKPWAAAMVCLLTAVGLAASVGVGAVIGYRLHAPSTVTPADPVKEYAMNRLCSRSIGECEHLIHVIMQTQKGDAK